MHKYNFKNSNLFIGAIGDADIVRELNSRGCNLSTGYNVQCMMLDGLEADGYDCDTITGHVSPPVCFKNLVVDLKSGNRNEHVTDISVSFLNLPLIDKVIKGSKILVIAKKWVRKMDQPYIFVYSLATVFLLGAVSAKRCNKMCRIVAVVPDLPEYMSNSQGKLYRMLKRIDRRIINACLEKFDGFVLFSEHMKERLPVGNKPYTVVEGIIRKVDREKYLQRVQKRISQPNKIIMLSGNLDREEGIPLLLEAFSGIKDSEFRLWLTGTGNAEDLILEYERKDARIHYYGYIASYEKFLKLQQEAYVFVLMVPKSHIKAAYYFPSKLMEYLVTGGIVACYKLPCIPDEYDEYLEYLPEGAEHVRRKLTELCEMNVNIYEKHALRRFQFLEKKTPEMQMKKVTGLLEKL